MRRRAVPIALLLIASAGAVLSARHFSLVRSVPAADSTVEASPERLQAWFSQVPAAGVSQLRLGPQADPKADIEIGKTITDAILGRDYPVVQAVTLITAVLYLTVNLVVDVSYAFLDPRIRLT